MYNGEDCRIAYLDCRGYYDLAAEMVAVLIAAATLYRAMVNYRQLKAEKGKDKDNIEYENSLRRKQKVNLLNLAFLVGCLGHVGMSMVMFQVVNEWGIEEVKGKELEKWYKMSQVVVVELLNVLLLAVGLLYWHGLNFFYSVQSIPAPLQFSLAAKGLIFTLVGYCACSLAAGTYLIFHTDSPFLQSLLILISTALCTSVFLYFRIAYYRYIFRSVRISRRIIIRQRIYNSLVLFSSACRITLCLLDMYTVDLDQLRDYNSDCHDTLPIHGILLLFLTLSIDLLPPLVFSRIFTTFQRQKNMQYSQNYQTLYSGRGSQVYQESGESSG